MERLSYERRRVVRSCRLCAATVYGRGAVAYCETCRGSDDARRDSYLRQAFKMTLAEYRLMLARQGGTCAVSDCMAEPTVVDHDHACCDRAGSSCGACVRGLLCHNHNVLIGLAHDSAETLRAAADYVDRANTFALTERDTAA